MEMKWYSATLWFGQGIAEVEVARCHAQNKAPTGMKSLLMAAYQPTPVLSVASMARMTSLDFLVVDSKELRSLTRV
jgi:uncharacterized protein YpmB